MSRNLTAGMVTQVTADTLRPIVLVKMEFNAGDVNLWSGIGELTWNGDTYTGAGNLLSLSKVTENNRGDAQNTTFELSGISTALLVVAMTAHYQGRPVSAWFAAIDDAGAIIADPYLFFKGQMDVFSSSISGDTATLSMRCESRNVDINRAKESRYTDECQKALYPDDKGLEFVTSLQDAQVVWGRPSP